MKKLLRILGTILFLLLFVLSVGPFLVLVPPLENTVSARSLAEEPSQFLTLPYPGTDGLDIHYWDSETDGQNYLLLHGFASNLYTWDELFPYLAEQGRVASYDRIGFGLSERPLAGSWQAENPYSRDAAVSHAITFMDELRLDSAILVGNSAGGSLAMQIALEHPDRVDGLILAAPAVFTGNGAPAFVVSLAETPQLQRIGPLFARILATLEPPDTYTAVQKERAAIGTKVDNWDVALWEFTAASSQFDLESRFAELTLPILVIAGADDTIVPTEQSIRLAGELPNAELVVIPDCGHTPQQECDAAFNQAVEDWLATLPGK
ncbi:alpha/beta fold hydrolase [Candidatus Leptofilum sp.]|uniref:alpha/beta fold hydrolase n=1 Tax=Candidatus Leptofilum sp. TaxID=3241576 RepID=UPI003B5C29C9